MKCQVCDNKSVENSELCPLCDGLLRWFRSYFAHEPRLELGKISIKTRFQAGLGVDSLDYICWLAESEEKLGIEIPDRQAEYFHTVGQFLRYLRQHGACWPENWEQPASLFLQYPGLLPFEALGQSESPAEMLRQATQLVEQIEEPTTRANLLAASAILAGLRLEEDVIYRLVRRDIMQESVIYRSIQNDEKRAIALNLLRGGVDINLIASSTGLSIKEVHQLQQQMNAVPQS